MSESTSTIRVGVVGVGRGQSFARGAAHAGMELVALCDTWADRVERVGKDMGVAAYTNFDDMLEHDLDAVILANYFHEHAPLAIKALGAGLHVMSECAACHTMAEGVALARAVERTGKTYMFAENYPFMAYNQEMRRLFREGVVGDFLYGEGEYVHPDPPEVKAARSVGRDHWRNWIPATYYCTHSIAPVMFITDTMPVSVTAHVIAYDENDPTMTMNCRRADTACAMMLRMDNGAVVKSLHGNLRGHGNYTRIHGNLGLMENSRVADRGMLKVLREPWEKHKGEPVETIYRPDFPEHHDDAVRAGHGGGDFFTNYHFANAIRTGEPPYLDVYRGVAMTACGIQGWRSALDDGKPYPIPNFADEAARKPFEDDHWSPDPTRSDPNKPPVSIKGHIEPSDEAKAKCREIWKSKGYEGE